MLEVENIWIFIILTWFVKVMEHLSVCPAFMRASYPPDTLSEVSLGLATCLSLQGHIWRKGAHFKLGLTFCGVWRNGGRGNTCWSSLEI